MTNAHKDSIHKDSIRKQLLLKRQKHPSFAQQQKSRQAVKHIQSSSVFKQAQHIAFYHAVRGEADPAKLAIQSTHQQFYLPVLSSDDHTGLVFVPINQNTQYQNNQFLIPEPIFQAEDCIAADKLDLVLMPLLGFDHQGNRLGMGGGYYDRCFAFKQHFRQQFNQDPKQKRNNKKQPTLIGFAYDFQAVNTLKPEPWDVPLDMVVTESGLKICN